MHAAVGACFVPQLPELACGGLCASHVPPHPHVCYVCMRARCVLAVRGLYHHWIAGAHVFSHSAGCLLIKEAGGKVTDATGEPYAITTRNIIASNGTALHEALLEVAQQQAADARSDAAELLAQAAVGVAGPSTPAFQSITGGDGAPVLHSAAFAQPGGEAAV